MKMEEVGVKDWASLWHKPNLFKCKKSRGEEVISMAPDLTCCPSEKVEKLEVSRVK